SLWGGCSPFPESSPERSLVGHSGSRSRNRDRRYGACLRQLPQRVYPSHASGDFCHHAALGLPEVQATDRFLRQSSCLELADPARPLPQLQNENLSALSSDRTAHRRSLSGLLLVFRILAFHAEIHRVLISVARLDLHRRRNQASA